ncbi:MAG: aspartate/glutamate racemase family protein [Pseudomonadota bacterium]
MAILIVNPNANPAVTSAIDATAEAFRPASPDAIEVIDLPDAPFGIESQRDADLVAPMLSRLAAERQDLDGLIVACFSDPGVPGCREAAPYPVWGIGEASVMTALARVESAGVIALSESAIARHYRIWRRLGIASRIAGEVAVDLHVADSVDGAALPRLEAAGQTLIARGAEALILGCAGMGHHAAALEARLGRPVIDPVAAATGLAVASALTASRGLAPIRTVL